MRARSSSRPFAQVDVFGASPFRGNPLAVVLDADGLDEGTMRAFASWTNLSETTFVLPPTQEGADYRVRILTPSTELDFAGHPTLGTAAAWLAAGGVPAGERIVQECGAGLVEVRRDEAAGTLAFAAPPLRRGGPLEAEHVGAAAAALGIDPGAVRGHAWVDNGAGWCVLELGSAAEVLALAPDLAAIPARKIAALGVVGPTGTDGADGAAYEVRGFVAADPESGTAGYEDPVTGSLNAGIAQWMLERGALTPPWTAHQGTALRRDGLVHLDVDADGTVWVGGTVRVDLRGSIDI
ncbi:PhzF family phenazine biosynthesis protein [Brachybacterium squillarum]|uniref:PhzF family phenazine biosynthesis protein n=1 Tax=Brachybacterium squillarum TaxID=661979 RepID=UPI002223DC87|nr:PhzF family phenazine biosynthesis protein [Brachybacterium squillarum]MCW1803852.1 PhzF family phenazine biosynthesis protein [Brachybacterium squillarum]